MELNKTRFRLSWAKLFCPIQINHGNTLFDQNSQLNKRFWGEQRLHNEREQFAFRIC